ncbi:transcription termination factor NusA [Cerasicoccus maritimus]|uniref:transcription termination factor NusA n=1 Tax=Cerasicoccus maritimus TaxID=490089 RepID=UPI002852D201|nr:transcription termination factor NusA [Cerasicoccus maritimus]
MSNEILSVLEYMEKEKGISREDMILTISSAIRNAAQRGVNAGQELKVEINPRNGALKAWAELTVVDSVSDPACEIHIEKAGVYKKDAMIGDTVYREVDPAFLGRIAAQTARQAIMQRIRQFEKERIFDDYKDQVGDVVSGVVRRRERGDLIVDLGKAEAVLPPRERVPGEDYAPGERIRCLLLKIDTTPRGPELILSRASLHFVRRLFELEVTEIADGTVTIEGMAREPGYRSKLAVHSADPKVDPVGACVGARGARVKSIVRELGGEKIDIIKYDPDPIALLHEAIKPAVPRNIRMDDEHRRIYFEVNEEDLSIAIGRRGQNAKLTSKLLGWRLDIGKLKVQEQGFDEKRQEAILTLAERTGLQVPRAAILVDNGLNNIEAFVGVEADDLMDMGLNEEEANLVIAKVAESISG